MTGYLLANGKHLDEILESFCTRPKRDLSNLEADVTSCVNRVSGIEFFVREHCMS